MGLCRRSVQRFSLAATTAATLLSSDPAAATVYHVAQTAGGGAHDGSAASPFLTISACAAVVQAGDSCIVHSGTYRETVSLATSGTAEQPIVVAVADGECATVTGTEPLAAAFTRGTANVWTATVTDSFEQLFASGVMVWEAQWPNRAPGVLFDAPRGVAKAGTGVLAADGGVAVSRLVDDAIPPGDWTGATVYILPGARWQADSRRIAAYDESTHTITFDTAQPWGEAALQPIAGNQYYLYGSPLALDAQDEWLLDGNTLHYVSTDDPAGHGLEYKKRPYAFDVTGAYVQVVGFRVFGAAVRVRGSHDTVDSVSIEYSSHLRSFENYATVGDVNRIAGDDNVWKNSIIDKSGSAGLFVEGSRNLVINNVARDVVYQATNQAAFGTEFWSSVCVDNQFVYNTVMRSGRAGIFLNGWQHGRALFNKVSDWGLLSNDIGAIYAWGTDGQGTEIAYNDVGGTSAFWAQGIYLDDRSKHFLVHHNHVHDVLFYGFCIKGESHFFNNTLARVGTPALIDQAAQLGWTDTNRARFQNNVADGTLMVRVGLQASGQDWGQYEAQVRATGEWTHVEIPFSTLYLPQWCPQVPLDLTSPKQLVFVPSTNGDFNVDLDNLQLVGGAGLMLDDFESAGGPNAFGGYAWGGGSGDGTTGTRGALTFEQGGATAASTRFARFSGRMVMGESSWGQMDETLPNADLSPYTGIAFDLRGVRSGLEILAPGGNSPVQDHNASCAVSGADVPACAIDQGIAIPGVTDGFGGIAPDLGAFESGRAPWSAGARRSTDLGCGKHPDVTDPLPPRAPDPWSTDAGADAIGIDAGADSGADGTAFDAAPDSRAGSPASGCGCRAAGRGGPTALALLLLALLRGRRGADRPRVRTPGRP